jgi:hypothetical protein
VPAAGSRVDRRVWAATPGQDQPASLVFTWPEPVTVSTVVYYADTTWGLRAFKDYAIYLDDAAGPVVAGVFQTGHGPQAVTLPAPASVRTLRLEYVAGVTFTLGDAEPEPVEPAPVVRLPGGGRQIGLGSFLVLPRDASQGTAERIWIGVQGPRPDADLAAALAAVDRPTGEDATAVRARRLALGELSPAVAAVVRRATAVAERADADPGGFEGGPEQIWSEASRRDAIFGRRLVVDAWRAARRRAATAVLGGGDSATVAATALPWAAFALRLGLSELGGAARGGGRQGQQEAKGDPLAAWLRREIDAARKAVRTGSGPELYQKATLEYLDRVDDLLRY